MQAMLALFNAIPKWFWTGLAAVLATTSCTLKYSKDGLELELSRVKIAAAERQAFYAAQIADAEQALLNAQTQVLTAEREIVVAQMAIEERKNEEVRAAVAIADDLRRRLRVAQAAAARPVAAATATASADTTPREITAGSNRPVVLGTLGEEDVSEALRAETIRAGLLACYASYDAARAQLLLLGVSPE